MKYLLLFALIFIVFDLAAQNAYFQQKVDYKINVKLDDKACVLKGKLQLSYFNNSRSSIDTIWFHLWPNAYENEQTAFAKQQLEMGETGFFLSSDEQRGFIDSLDFTSNGVKLTWDYDSQNKDICFIILNQKLLFKQSISIETPFRVKIPSDEFSRLGCGDGNFQLSQWYPKPAVFDVNGWHPIAYLNQGEFYSEFGSFDVHISLPKNYVVAATGIMQDDEQETQFMNDQSVKLTIDKDDYETPDSDTNFKTLHFVADSVHDFAWFASKTFIFKSRTIILPSGRTTQCRLFYHPSGSNNWDEAIDWMARSVIYYSQKIGEYPYNQISVVDGALTAGGGMEYPMITIISNDNNKRSLEETIIHEIAHNWFYGILAFNERDNAWMDEGLTTFFQNRYSNYFYPNAKLFENYMPAAFAGKSFFKLNQSFEEYFTYLFMASRNLDSKPSAASEMHSSLNYGSSVYYKTALSFRYLNAYLGDEKFDSVMIAFYNEWKFRHPQPNDLVDFFAQQTNNASDVFFQELICNNGKNDYSIRRVKPLAPDSILVVVANKGGLKLPVQIYELDNNGALIFSEWYEGFKGSRKFVLPIKHVAQLGLDLEDKMLDINFYNQTIRTKYRIKNYRKPRLRFLLSEPDKSRADLFYTPVAGYNLYNGFMVGVLLYNSLLFEKKWEYRIMPMYSILQRGISSEVGLYRNFHLNKTSVRKISFGVTSKLYLYDKVNNWNLGFFKLQPEAVLYFRYPKNRSFVSSVLKLDLPMIFKNTIEYVKQDTVYVAHSNEVRFQVLRLSYNYKNNRKLYPFSISTEIQANVNYVKIGFEYKYKLNYSNVKSGLYFRFFTGKVFSFAGDDFDYSLKMSNQTGANDYLMDETFIGRSEYQGFLSHQMKEAEGGFNVNTAIGRSNDWIVAVNLKSSLYKINFIKIYFNAGTYANAKTIFPGSQILLYEGGFNLSIIPETVEVYFPLFYSSDIKNELYLNNKDSFGDRIRFVLKFDMANPFKWLKELNL